jgi:alginate O-acetyltransferase complex protein AlgI
MNFADFAFWVHLVSALVVVWLVRGVAGMAFPTADRSRLDRALLLTVSLYLLARISLLTSAIFLFTAVVAFFGSRLLRSWTHRPGRRLLLAFIIALLLAPLIWFKYRVFFGHEILRISDVGAADWLIPAGISFYTFQKISYVVDSLRAEGPEPSGLNFLNFAAFFPQLVAGPIERRAALLPQLEGFRFHFDPAAVIEGASWIVTGLFYKRVLADNLAEYFISGGVINAYSTILNATTFGLLIYFDFCGYSLIALGIARALGIRLTLNFSSPYLAANIVEFWRRWNITLSRWFRDYVYIPLGGGRTRRWALNVAVVFLLAGFWHGAGWNFLIWGLLHAAFVIGYRLLRPTFVPSGVAIALTNLFCFVAWIPFYEKDPQRILNSWLSLVQPAAYDRLSWSLVVNSGNLPVVLAHCAFLGLALVVLLMEGGSLRRAGAPYELFLRPASQGVMVFLIVVLAPNAYNQFIYFSF